MQVAPTPLIIAGRYRFIGEIGRGAMGAVWLVEHVHTGDQLAMKVMHKSFGENPEMVERFRREARAAAKIKSEHVVRVTDADIAPELGNTPFMVMEVLEGEDLRRRQSKVGRFTHEQTISILWQVARALDRAHGVGIVHRDLKPENLFLHMREDGLEIVKLLDFGVAKMRDDLHSSFAVSDPNATNVGTLLGTPYYMSPEQVRNATITPQTDVWAIGFVAFRMLTGAHYWPSATTVELLGMILREPMVSASSKVPQVPLGDAFDAWFARSCDRDPSRRWTTVGEQVAALADAFGLVLPGSISMSGQLPATQSHSGVLTARRDAHGQPRRRSVAGVLVPMAIVVALGVGGFFGWQWFVHRTPAPVEALPIAQPAQSVHVATAVEPMVTATVTTTAPTSSHVNTPTIDVNALPTTQATEPVTTARPKKKDDDPWAR
jgi:serine/threonine-protein kinase